MNQHYDRHHSRHLEESKNNKKVLPVYKHRDSILEFIRGSLSVCIIVGETGSGKSTLLPQLLLKSSEFSRDGKMIAISQPRRVAAMSVANHVAEELGCRVGTTVGYKVRFDDCASDGTRIKYLTDGCLLREFVGGNRNNGDDIDKVLNDRYSAIIIDEAHERSLATDVLLGLVKSKYVSPSQQQKKQIGPKIIIMSATLQVDKFCEYFDTDRSFHIPGSLYSVNIVYCDVINKKYFQQLHLHQQDKLLYGGASNHDKDVVRLVMDIHCNKEEGDILVFLTGQVEIERVCNLIFKASENMDYKYDVSSYPNIKGLAVLPLYSYLPIRKQKKCFESYGSGIRKIIVSTNIAATSITIQGIKYVIDLGFVKQNIFNAKNGIHSLDIVPISKSEARQRSGRAGRTCAGTCYRLYSQESYDLYLPETTCPEMLRSNLANTILLLKSYGIDDVCAFPLLDPPKRAIVKATLKTLILLDAVSPETGKSTEFGLEMCQFPIIPEYSCILLSSLHKECFREVLVIISCLCADRIYVDNQDVYLENRWNFFKEQQQQQQLFNKQDLGHLELDDAIGLLFIYHSYWSIKQDNIKTPHQRQLCTDLGIRHQSMVTAKNICQQLQSIALRIMKKDSNSSSSSSNSGGSDEDWTTSVGSSSRLRLNIDLCQAIQQCMCNGLFSQVARRAKTNNYSKGSGQFRTMNGNGHLVYINPGSVFYKSKSITCGNSNLVDDLNWCAYAYISFTWAYPCMNTIIKIRYKWVEKLLEKMHQLDDLSRINTNGVVMPHGSISNIFSHNNSISKEGGNDESIKYKRNTSDGVVNLAKERYLKRRKKKKIL